MLHGFDSTPSGSKEGNRDKVFGGKNSHLGQDWTPPLDCINLYYQLIDFLIFYLLLLITLHYPLKKQKSTLIAN